MKTLKILLLCLITLQGCDSSFLDVKMDQAMEVPTTLNDFDLLLANNSILCHSSGHLIGSVSGEEFHLSQNSYDLITRPEEQAAYLWEADDFYGRESTDWNYPFQRVLYCNIILEGMKKIQRNEINSEEYDKIKGEALFHRANAVFMLSQLFAAPFGDADHAEFGIPIPLTPDPSWGSQRSSVEATYHQIEKDLLEAKDLLNITSENIYRPNKIAVLGLLARLNLITGEYSSALSFGKEALGFKDDLINFNTLIPANENYSFPMHGNGNIEIIFYDCSYTGQMFYEDKYRVNGSLFGEYKENDLRKKYFFQSKLDGHSYKGSYVGNLNFFTGIATDELYLIVAECEIRTNRIQAGIEKLNELLKNRTQEGLFVPLGELEQSVALEVVLNERRKELINRGLRWSDLRRLNFIDNRDISLQRTLDWKEYNISGKDKRFTFLIPHNVIEKSSVTQFNR